MPIAAYIAAPLSQARAASELAADLLERGIVATSRWHNAVVAAGATRDPESEQTRREVLTENLADLEAASAIVALCHAGTPRGTLHELGYAVARGLPVVRTHFGATGRDIFDAHPLVTRVDLADSTRRSLADRVAAALSAR